MCKNEINIRTIELKHMVESLIIVSLHKSRSDEVATM